MTNHITYMCPMHPEIRSKKPGRCSICGMKLVLESEVHSAPKTHGSENMGLGKLTWRNYLPLIVIVSLILLTAFTATMREFTIVDFIENFMAGFFLTFAGFKLLDLNGFAQGYFTYDLLAKRWFAYGYVYPFIELFFGLSMIAGLVPVWLLVIEFIVMTFSGIGVALKLAKKERFQCVCLGTFLKVPLTKVTLVEDFGMATLALLVILSRVL